ncbi:helix-turn-helix domain-containing protein [Pedobacter cryophilus]|uniref:Transcriptional regulator n=1 Tax=Pedobacter cryophilus TaxID=2571271 RepID=A0A4U1C0T8_9SPHI|nr:transcriptional regulator [Pedobacter cryophilus]TKB98567.1 transcriptional regulator [Pedobacter cryophilus]
MNLHILKTDEEYQELLDWVDAQFDLNISIDSKVGEDLQVALLLIKQYEDVHFKIPKPDPLLVVKQKMEEEGLKNKDLINWIGSKSYVSALLSGKKPLTLKIAKVLHQKLGIPAEVFLA